MSRRKVACWLAAKRVSQHASRRSVLWRPSVTWRKALTGAGWASATGTVAVASAWSTATWSAPVASRTPSAPSRRALLTSIPAEAGGGPLAGERRRARWRGSDGERDGSGRGQR